MSAYAIPDPSPAGQLGRLNSLLAETWKNNCFYRSHWQRAGFDRAQLNAWSELQELPCITRDDLVADQIVQGALGTNLNLAPGDFVRIHRSSGTTRAPLYWADDPASWRETVAASTALWRIAGLTTQDRVLVLMDFGPSSGPWILYEGVCAMNGCALTTGKVDLAAALDFIRRFRPTVLAGNANGFLHVAEGGSRISVAELGVNRLICSGAPSVAEPGLREQLASLWAAECHDRYGLTEGGSVACECPAHPGGMHVLDDRLIVEVVEPGSDRLLEGEEAEGELVLTNLYRRGMPLIRYRTGDRTRLRRNFQCACGRRGNLLVGGIHRK